MKSELKIIPGHFKMDVFVVTITIGCLVFDIRLNLEIDQNMPLNSVDWTDVSKISREFPVDFEMSFVV